MVSRHQQAIADTARSRKGKIWRFLKAGVMEEGLLHESEAGTPQGGLITRPCWPTSSCTTYWIYGLKSALPEAVEDGQN